MKLFNLDSPIMRALTKMSYLMFINFYTLVLCILIIPAGAALTAMNYVCLKMVRDEDGSITKDYFRSFKENFKQGTAVGLISLLITVVLVMDYVIFKFNELPMENVLVGIIVVVAIIFACVQVFVYPTLAKFDNTVKNTFKNAFVISIMQFPKTVAILAMYAVPVYIIVYPVIRIFPLAIIFGLSVPAYFGAKMYSKFFQKLEDQVIANSQELNKEEEEAGEDERIFHDELYISDGSEKK